ncbi:MAG TPA: DUF3047 domain-containing protein, partial [Spirochaetota bacterium]|nr:DUF3047 domain-containing protein [Spirochaetota bacterium]
MYRLASENGNTFMKADAYRSSIQIAKQVQWNINRHPVVSWKWRARHLPPGGNEEFGRTNDSAASIYIIFIRRRMPLLPVNAQ